MRMATSNLSPEEEREVNTFQEKIKNEVQETILWNTAVKFLMARKFDRQRAVELFLNHKSTRQREDLTQIDPTDAVLQKELATAKFTILPGRDKHGATIALFTARLHYPPLTSHQQVLKGLIVQLDAALESMETQRHGLVFIYDMTDSKYSNFDYELSKKILNMLKGGYPAKLKKVLIVTAPLWFKAPFKILRLFVREKLRDRVFTVSMSQLPLHIPSESLPKQLGGTLDSNHALWLQICLHVAQKQSVDVNSYFLPCKRKQSQTSVGQRSSVSRRSLSSDISENLFISDIESEDSKETITEKQSDEDREKEHEMNTEKEVIDEKEVNHGTSKRRRESDTLIDTESTKRVVSQSQDEIISQSEENEGQETPKKKRSSSAVSNSIYEESVHGPDSKGISLELLVEHVRNTKRKGLLQEYALIKMEPPAGTFSVSKAKHNLPKNRYSDVLCLDQTRVKLPIVDGDTSSDYINANYLDGYLHKNAYISTQGPLPRTFGDFWRMVWHCQVVVVVMTTRAIERGRMKCGQYWPIEEDAEEQFEEFVVINTQVEQYQDYTVTWLYLHNTTTGESRQVHHLQFTSWPDYGVPHSASAFLDFLFKVRACQEEGAKMLGSSWQGHSQGPPIVVHCSAGIGRTGTFITIDISLRRLEHIGTVDIHETVRKIRGQRAFSIQMPDQYVFCHFAVIEHAMRQGVLGDIDWTGFDDSDSEDSD